MKDLRSTCDKMNEIKKFQLIKQGGMLSDLSTGFYTPIQTSANSSSHIEKHSVHARFCMVMRIDPYAFPLILGKA